MDYKKKYEEAVKKLKKFFTDNDDRILYKHDIETVFPELKQSDDEKIRKEIEVILANTDLSRFALHYTFADMLTWLEKQGEQRHAEDNCKISDCDTKVDMDEYRKGFECGKQRVLKYPEDFNLCEKSASAWSEEDEEMFDAIIADIQFTKKAHAHDDNQVVYEREIDWLKSLKERHAWKPTGEQIEALKAMVRYCDIATSFDAHKQRIVKSLIEDFKNYMKGE